MPIEIGFLICYNLKNIIEYADFVDFDKYFAKFIIWGLTYLHEVADNLI